MCVPQAVMAIQTAVNIATSVGKTVYEHKQQKQENEYRTQIAYNNIQTANNNAKQQIQQGIEKSREEKISGLRQASALLAKNASSNTDVMSDTNLLNYSDLQDASFNNAENIMDSYTLKADDYYKQANNYGLNLAYQQKKYNNDMRKNALNSLGTYTKVASNWYLNNSGGSDYDTV